jgi:predicted naringenin-chalcone synthase
VTTAYLNRIATGVPPHQVHDAFVHFARFMIADPRKRTIFEHMAKRGQIDQRWSCLLPASDWMSASIGGKEFYALKRFPATGERMRQYETAALALAGQTVAELELGRLANKITHVIVTSCTGFAAPGLDLQLIQRFGLNASVERTIIGFMGCYAAINALKLARHIVRSAPAAKVLIVSVELCTLHFQPTEDLEQLLVFLLFADGCAAALVSAEPKGLSLDRFYSAVLPETADQMGWHIGDGGFDMMLSGRVPASLGTALRSQSSQILAGATPGDIDLWAVHPGGKSVLDAVETAFALPPAALETSRHILRMFGNMSSATVLFVLKAFLEGRERGAKGCAMAFGPGLTAETMLFRTAGP